MELVPNYHLDDLRVLVSMSIILEPENPRSAKAPTTPRTIGRMPRRLLARYGVREARIQRYVKGRRKSGVCHLAKVTKPTPLQHGVDPLEEAFSKVK